MPALAADSALAPRQAEIGEAGSYDMRAGEVFVDVAREFDLGFVQMIIANPGVDPWLSSPGRRLTLPGVYLLPDAPRRGIVINLAEQRLYYFPANGKSVETYPIGVGVLAGATPVGVTQVVAKENGPVWVPPPSIRAAEPDLPASIPPGPDNPLGAFALRLGWNNYLIHGTNHPFGIGRDVSHGCIRLYPEDIEKLFREVPVGTPVRVVDQQVKVAWVDDQLMAEVFPSKERIGAIDLGKDVPRTMPPDLVPRVMAAAGDLASQVDWNKVNAIGLEQNGIPVAVLDRPLISSDEPPAALSDDIAVPRRDDRRHAHASVAADLDESE
jgi:L,D-transpeptidase ErfK/SrfK